MEDALAVLLRGLTDYMNGESDSNRSEMLDGIANCQVGARDAMMGLILWNIPMGLSHAIGHQLGSTCGVMHGVTSCIMLAPVLRYNASKSEKQRHLQQSVLEIWNKVLERDESSLADAVANFVKSLGLPSTLREVGIQEPADIEKVVDSTMTDVFGAMEGMGQKQDVLAILESAKGRETVITPAGTITTTITLSGPVATTTIITLPRPVVTTTTTTTLDSPDPTSTTTTTINYPGPMVTTTYAGPDSTVTVYGKRDIAAAHFKGKEEGEERWNAWTKEWRPAPHCCDITTTATRIGTRRPHHVLPSYVPRSVIDPEVIMVYPTPTTFSGGSRTWTLEFAGRTSTITTTLTHEWQPATIEAGTYTATLSSIDRSKRPSATATDASDMIKDRPEPMKTITLDDSYTYTEPTDVPMKTITLRA